MRERKKTPEATPEKKTPRKKTAGKTPDGDARAQLARSLDEFEPEIAALARRCLDRMRALAPGAVELVYDAYNALSIPFATGEKLGDAFLAVVVYPRHVNLAFNKGAGLPDPKKLLVGDGTHIRHVRIDDDLLASPDVEALVRLAAARAGFLPGDEARTVLKKIYPRRRPRRPSPSDR